MKKWVVELTASLPGLDQKESDLVKYRIQKAKERIEEVENVILAGELELDIFNTSLLQSLFKHNIILKKGPEHPKGFLLKSGKTSDLYINMRETLRSPSLFSSIIAALERVVREIPVDKDTCFLGVPTMGAVLAPVLAVGRQANLAVIRLNKKSHGVGAGAIEGNFTKKIIIIDDVITSGTSVREIEEAYIKMYQPNAEVKIITVIDRQDHNYKNVTSLFTLEDIKKFAKRKTEKNYTTTGVEI